LLFAFASGRANGGSAGPKAPPILFAGGFGKNGTLASAELFRPNQGPSGSFVGTGPMSTARVYHTATVLKDGRVLIAGGSSEVVSPAIIFASSELYDPSKGKFSNTGTMLDARTGHTATLLADGRVLIAGGDDDTESLSSSELYDPLSGEFTETGTMNIPRDNCTATRLANGKVLITGGFQLLPDFTGSVQDTAEIYDPATGSFSLTGTMNSARESHTATLLPDGRVLITGGFDNNGTGLDIVELYNPTTGHFRPAGKMTTSRSGHLAAALGDGDVLVAGGIDNRGVSLKSAEIFVAGTGKFMKVAAMPRDRFSVGATVLSSTEILVAGGYTQCPSGFASFCEKPVRTALIFDHTTDTFRSIPSMTAPRGSFASATLSHVAH
jgi:hypothetical protein